jgi:hypothetical protein
LTLATKIVLPRLRISIEEDDQLCPKLFFVVTRIKFCIPRIVVSAYAVL